MPLAGFEPASVSTLGRVHYHLANRSLSISMLSYVLFHLTNTIDAPVPQLDGVSGRGEDRQVIRADGNATGLLLVTRLRYLLQALHWNNEGDLRATSVTFFC